jgi:hypothetical protein
MLFVADRIAKELARIIEFLNEQMRPAEVLAIEVEQFTSDSGMRIDLESRHGTEARQGAEKAIVWFRANGFETRMTQSQDTIQARVAHSDGKQVSPFHIRRSSGRLETSLQNLAGVPIFAAEEARQRALDKILALPAKTLKASAMLTGWPSLSLEELLDSKLWTAFAGLASDLKRDIDRWSI